jgi:hypothetical protein
MHGLGVRILLPSVRYFYAMTEEAFVAGDVFWDGLAGVGLGE